MASSILARQPAPDVSRLRITLFALAWSFVLAVAAYDVLFAWHYRAGFDEWEMNPLARWAGHLGGLGVVFALKAALLAFALWVGWQCHRRRHWLAVPYTLFACGVHVLLSLHYLAGGIA
jgi:hypothetical protein